MLKRCADQAHPANRLTHSHKDIQGLARKLNFLGDRLGDIEELLRQRG
jgi:hypothetical protein